MLALPELMQSLSENVLSGDMSFLQERVREVPGYATYPPVSEHLSNQIPPRRHHTSSKWPFRCVDQETLRRNGLPHMCVAISTE